MTAGQSFRAAEGGFVDRDRELRFRFDGRELVGHPGDTLASALLANGVRLVGRSFKYHRPRGILTAGSEEPNALVTLGEGGRAETNTRATQIELFDGLVARSQNAWPTLAFDLGEINSLLSPFIPAGFYYKTFMGGPRGSWTRLYEPVIRRMAGLGPAPTASDPDIYDKRHTHCDVLVVGAGAAGLAAARAAAAGGARVILIDERPKPGGSLLASPDRVEGLPAAEWAARSALALESQSEGHFLNRTTAFGRYDHNLVMAVERLKDHEPGKSGPRQRVWQIRAKQVVLATGAHEQPLLFGNNDRPGVMLASAGQRYAREYGVLAGRRVLVATNNNGAYEAAQAISEAGAEVVAVVDARARSNRGGDVLWQAAVRRVHGHTAVTGAEIVAENGGRRRHVSCDAILMSGGWQPALHLFSHAGGRTRYDDQLGCFVPANSLPGVATVGGCAGRFDLADCLADGHAAGARAAAECGYPTALQAPFSSAAGVSGSREPHFTPPPPAKSFVDFQNDVTTSDIALAHREGFVSVEHLKRYTTTGMATDQGKLSNLNALSRMACHLGATPAEVGTTTFRPPYTPVAFGALAGMDRGHLMEPVRKTSIHDWHEAQGALFEDVGQWKRPWYYPRPGETLDAAVQRECLAVRNGVGMFDASTLGKIDIRGADAATFLNLVYTNAWSKLAIGRCRYGVMCSEDGMVMDDGVTSRTGPDRFLMTTTTGNAARVFDHLEDLLQTEWPHLRVFLTSVTDHWAAFVVAGPRARDLLSTVATDIDLSSDAFPHLSMREARIIGNAVRIYRISFSGELAYEVHVAAQKGRQVWDAIFAAGQEFHVTPYGTEAMHVLRAEKGYIIIGQETDGTVTPDDLGLSWAIARSKDDFIGKRSLARPDCVRDDRRQLVGLRPLDDRTVVEEGAQLTEGPHQGTPVPMLGHVTSSYWSASLARPIALALLERGHQRHGDIIHAHGAGSITACSVVAPNFYDVTGERMNG